RPGEGHEDDGGARVGRGGRAAGAPRSGTRDLPAAAGGQGTSRGARLRSPPGRVADVGGGSGNRTVHAGGRGGRVLLLHGGVAERGQACRRRVLHRRTGVGGGGRPAAR